MHSARMRRVHGVQPGVEARAARVVAGGFTGRRQSRAVADIAATDEPFHAGEDVHGWVRTLIADSWARCSSAGLTARTQTDSVLDDREIEERWGDHLLRPLMPLLEGLPSEATNEAAHLLAITDAHTRVSRPTDGPADRS